MRVEEEKLNHLIQRMKTDDSVDAPASAVTYLKNYFRSNIVSRPSVIERIRAVMSSEILPGTAILGERSGTATGPRQVLFDAGEDAVDIRISPGERGFTLKGQVLGYGFENGRIEMGQHAGSIDHDGQFLFENIPAGVYDVFVKRDDLEIVIEGLVLQ